MTTREKIASLLNEHLGPALVRVEDESSRHAGHPGAASGGGHFKCRVVAATFEGKTTLERHRQVYAALAELMKHEIHALALETLAPSESDGEPVSIPSRRW